MAKAQREARKMILSHNKAKHNSNSEKPSIMLIPYSPNSKKAQTLSKK